METIVEERAEVTLDEHFNMVTWFFLAPGGVVVEKEFASL